MTLQEFKTITNAYPITPRMPVLFMGHGNPMNAIEKNRYSTAWAELGARLPRPNAVLCVSAHWLTEGTFVHVAERPRIIYDFWGFPEELYNVQYPCLGAPISARDTQVLVKSALVREDTEWGLDHGTWVVMRHLFPKADAPVFQLSIDISRPHAAHYALAQELAALREKGVLIVGSGNIVHNLGRIRFESDAKPFDWAIEFDELVKDCILSSNDDSLVRYDRLRASSLAVPTPDHYWPLLYALGARDARGQVTFPIDGIAHGSVSMRAVMWE